MPKLSPEVREWIDRMIDKVIIEKASYEEKIQLAGWLLTYTKNLERAGV